MTIKPLSELEQRVMEIVWDLKTCSVRDVLLRVNNKKTFAYTTIATILQRLQKKGLIVRKDRNFIVHYVPRVSKDMYGKTVAQSFFAKFFQSFGDAATASFAESIHTLPKAKKEYLLKLLSEHESK